MEAQFLRIRGRERIYPVSRLNPASSEVIVDTEIGEVPFPMASVEFINLEEMRPSMAASGPNPVFPEVDLHGLFVEDALDELDRAIENALAAGSRRLVVIHGKGTGALREAVWEHLRADKRVHRFALDHTRVDGTGVTRVDFV